MKSLLVLFIILTFSKAHAQRFENLMNEGAQAYRVQSYTLAETSFKAALEKQPSNEDAQYNLAAALYQQKKWAEAHGVLKKLIGATQNKALLSKLHYNNGVIYTKEKALLPSIEAYKAALRLDPTDKQTRENLQLALIELKRQQEQQKQQQQKQQSSKTDQREAEQKLKLLAEKEKQLQERLQQSGQKGSAQPKDW